MTGAAFISGKSINIQSTDQVQLDQIPEGCKWPVLRYVNPPPYVLVETPTLQERIRFPVLGMSKIAIQIYASYPNGQSTAFPTRYSQLRYAIVGYKDNAPYVTVRAGVVSPFYDQTLIEFWNNFNQVGIQFSTPNTGTGTPRPIVARYSVLVLP